jgi:hypothetical protein
MVSAHLQQRCVVEEESTYNRTKRLTNKCYSYDNLHVVVVLYVALKPRKNVLALLVNFTNIASPVDEYPFGGIR